MQYVHENTNALKLIFRVKITKLNKLIKPFLRRSKTEESQDRTSFPRSSRLPHQEDLQRSRHHPHQEGLQRSRHQYGSQPEVYRSILHGSKPERSQPINGGHGSERGCDTYYGSSYKLYGGGSQTSINDPAQLRTGRESKHKCIFKVRT